MRIIVSRAKKIWFFITLGVCMVALAVSLNVTWVILNWRIAANLVLGIILFGLLIAGLVVNTVYLVREIHRNEQQDSFLNAVTHELKTPIASIRLYLQTLERRPLEEAKRHEFYRIMLDDTDRLLGTVEQVLKAGEVRHGSDRRNWHEVDFSAL
ncbi:MAG: histidine kinase dimerization/phospho-acceptor domain-containing protein, partial [Terriglobales bacterium]